MFLFTYLITSGSRNKLANYHHHDDLKKNELRVISSHSFIQVWWLLWREGVMCNQWLWWRGEGWESRVLRKKEDWKIASSFVSFFYYTRRSLMLIIIWFKPFLKHETSSTTHSFTLYWLLWCISFFLKREGWEILWWEMTRWFPLNDSHVCEDVFASKIKKVRRGWSEEWGWKIVNEWLEIPKLH